MNKRLDNEENYLEILRKISDSKNLTQRELANQVGFSLGKLNYCLNELKKKGLVFLKMIVVRKFLLFSRLNWMWFKS
ncbi:MAG: hypothetical protein CBD34_00205 [Rickettsiales bacterium TMED174]|nr:MAG: hypothetical protein CBD34_00205 [Rickettsiales bacterium TMED174]